MAVVHARQPRYRFALNDKDRRGPGPRSDARLLEPARIVRPTWANAAFTGGDRD